MEEIIIRKTLYKWVLLILKATPVLLAFMSMLNTLLSYFDIDLVILSYIGGVSLLSLLFLYVASYAFKFCIYYRLFIHYVTLNWILNIVDYYVGIPVPDKSMFLIYMVITGAFLFLLLYYHQKCKRDGTL